MNFLDSLPKNWLPHFGSFIDDVKDKKDPDFFAPFGTQVFCGRQGSGKTISAVYSALKLKQRYPNSILVSNIRLKGFSAQTPSVLKSQKAGEGFTPNGNSRVVFDPVTDYYHFHTIEELGYLLTNINNGIKGVIYVIDEIHIYFNALDSKNIPVYIFTEISQQRKQRKVILGTSQLFLRMAKPFREQCDNLIICNTHFGFITTQRVYDGMDLDQDYNGKLVGNKKKSAWFYHNRRLRDSFDTFQKVVSGQEQYEDSRPVNIEMGKKKIKVQN